MNRGQRARSRGWPRGGSEACAWLVGALIVAAPGRLDAQAPAQAGEAAADEARVVSEVVVRGNRRTRTETLLELLPRPPPAVYSQGEVAEFERRINNLAVFDQVRVCRCGERLEVEVREKWTLIPSVEFSSGQTAEDTYALLGLTEYNVLGTANQLGVLAFREQRGWGGGAYFWEHGYRRNRWTLGVEGYFATAGYRFEDGNGWRTAQGTGYVWFTSPPLLGDYLNFRVGGSYGWERVSEVIGPSSPPSSQAVRTAFALSWDRYRWQDLVASGVKFEAKFGTGMLFGSSLLQPRHSAELSGQGALPFGERAVLMVRWNASVLSRGNSNFSYLLGSVRGVRGLPDSLYRNWAQAYVNVELRQAVRLAERWAVQGVAFGDAAVFEPMNAEGDRDKARSALSVGLGARLVPTWLASIVARVDGARLLAPEPAWFVQVGLSQYF